MWDRYSEIPARVPIELQIDAKAFSCSLRSFLRLLRHTRRGLNDDEPCAEVLRRLAAARGAINSLMGELMEDHIINHMPKNSKSADEAAEDIVQIVRTYLK